MTTQRKNILKIELVLIIALLVITSCKKGYLTPRYTPPITYTSVARIVNQLDIDQPIVSINQLPITSTTLVPGLIGTYQSSALSVVNGQTFKLTITPPKSGLGIDTMITVSADGQDSYYIYADATNASKYHIYTLHTPNELPPGKNNIKIRLVNLMTDLPGKGTVNVNFSRRQNIPVNNNMPLAFGTVTPYIEIPYGTYQPLLLDENGKPLFGQHPLDVFGGQVSDWPQINMQPGGIYTLVIAKTPGTVNPGSGIATEDTQLITDNIIQQEPVGKAMFVHADPYIGDITIEIDGQVIDNSPLAFSGNKNPLVLTQGNHLVQIFDHSKNVITQKNIVIDDQDRDVYFLVNSKSNIPEIQTFNLAQIDNYSTVASFFNFSPDSPPVTFLSERSSTIQGLFVPGNNVGLFSGYQADSLCVDVPYLRVPSLQGANAAPPIDGFNPKNYNYLIFNSAYEALVMMPPKVKIAFSTQGDQVTADEVVPGVFANYPFHEFPAFAEYNSVDRIFYEGDSGYFILMVIGLRYPNGSFTNLQLKAIKYVE